MCYYILRKVMDYNMIFIGLLFVYVVFLDYYLFFDLFMIKIWDYVDEYMNCEDIVMNYLIQSVIGCLVFWVKGKDGVRMILKLKGMFMIGIMKGYGVR